MKVAMVFPSENYEKGISTYSKDLIKALKKIGIDVHPITYENRKLISLLKIIPRLRKYNIIHIQHENRLFGFIDGIWFMPFITILNFIKKGKIIITLHTVHTRVEKLYSIHPLLSFLKRNFTHPLNYLFASFFTSLFIVHTSFLKKDLIGASGIKENKIVVIPQGVKRLQAHIGKKMAKKSLGLKGPVYLMIGTMGPNKGFDIVLNQAKKIGKTILIAGGFGSRKDYVSSLKKQITNDKIKGIVVLDLVKNGKPLSSKKWKNYFYASDIVLLPYKTMSTSGVFMDAMSANRPVIGSNSRYFSEISKKYKCVKVVKNEKDYPLLVREVMRDMKNIKKDIRRFTKENNILNIGKKHKEAYFKLSK